MIDLAILSAIVAKSIVSFGIKKGLSWITEKNKVTFEAKLVNVIQKTIEEYSENKPIADENGKFAFYKSQIFLEELLKHRFFSELGYQSDTITIISILKQETNIIVPTAEQLRSFLKMLEVNIQSDEMLKKLAIEENYKDEIFKISEKIVIIFTVLYEIKIETSEINQKVTKIIELLLVKNINIAPTYPKELTALVQIQKNDIVGREKDLQNLRESLLKNNETALINGMGGIGKTTLAAVYISEYYDDYDHIVWLTIENSLEEAIIASKDLLINLKIETTKSDELLNSCLNKLRILESDKPKLLVIDNTHENLAKHYDSLPKTNGWHLLVTSRHRINHFNITDLDFLSENEAIELFRNYAKHFSQEEARSIVKSVELHTLTIEILAKSADKNRWSFKTVTNALKLDAKAGVRVKHKNDKNIDHIKSYLTSIFDISNLSEHEIYLLKQFTALPNQWIKYDFLSELLQSKKLDWNDEFAGTLADLHSKGFILKDGKTDSNKMHPVLVEALVPCLYTTSVDLKFLIKSIADLLYLDDTKDNPIDKFQYIPFGETLLKQFSDNSDKEIVLLKNNLGLRYKDFGDFEKARDLLEQVINFYIKNFGNRHPDIATFQNNLAMVYQILGEFKKAKDLLRHTIQSFSKQLGDNHNIVVTLKSNLAIVYQDLDEFEKSRNLLEQALQSDLEKFSENHPRIANIKSNLALAYQNLDDFEKARDLLKQALLSDIENFGERHPKVSIRQSNLAMVYKNLGELEEARDLFKQALKSDIENFGDRHPNVAIRQSNLAVVYKNLDELDKAKDLLEKSLQSEIENFGEKHSNVARCKHNLATVYLELDEIDEAIVLWKNAYDIYLTTFGKHHSHTKMVKEFLDEYEK